MHPPGELFVPVTLLSNPTAKGVGKHDGNKRKGSPWEGEGLGVGWGASGQILPSAHVLGNEKGSLLAFLGVVLANFSRLGPLRRRLPGAEFK